MFILHRYQNLASGTRSVDAGCGAYNPEPFLLNEDEQEDQRYEQQLKIKFKRIFSFS